MATAFQLSRIGIEVNLPKGATYDLLLVSTTDGYPKGQVSFKFEETPRKITGIQKVAQTIIRILFTTKGSDLINPSFGTEFPNLVIGANRTSSESQFRADIISTVKDAENQVKYILNSATQDSASQLNSLVVQGFNSTLESVSLYLQVITKAGETASIAVPFPQLDLPISGNA